jgi:hypothetical protein
VEFSVSGFWVVISVLNFVFLAAVVYGVIRFVRWLVAGRRREAAEIVALRERVSQLEAAQDRPPITGLTRHPRSDVTNID